MEPLTWSAALAILKPLGIFIAGIVVYSVFVFKFYLFIARKDIITADFSKYNKAHHPFFQRMTAGILYFIKYLFLLPLYVLFWGMVLTGLLAFLSKNETIDQILLIAMALVGAVRVVAHYNEDLAKDVAKLLPFVLLGIFLVDVSYLDLDASIAMIVQTPAYFGTLTYYFLGVMGLEIVLRVLNGIFSPSE